MIKNYNKETGKTTWSFDEWYKKTYYVVGFGIVWFYITCAVIGLLIGISEL